MKAGQAQLTQVARAEPPDAFALAALELQLNREQGRAGEAGFLDRYADAWLAERDRRPAWLATSLDGSPLGAITLFVVDGLPRPGRLSRPWVHITNLYVTPGARRCGIGDRLLRAGLDWSRDNRALWVQLSATSAGSGLYRRAGFAPAESRLHRLDLP
ncbi:MAG: GNAT family N-acetyltransferase [Austwickia sp.]|nr:MAG: GNAT family N-acetyltransferase [Austwickia sp.]